MAVLRPFRAIRPVPERAAAVSAPPYDVVSRDEAAAIAAGNPFSFLRVSRPELELPAGTDPHADAIYARARENFAQLEREAPLIAEAEPSLYVYRLTAGAHSQTGIAGTFSLDEYDAGDIRIHERTRKDKEDDRTRHVVTLGAQTGPVFLAYRELAAVEREVARAVAGTPLYDFTAQDGVKHTLWRVADPRVLARAFAEVPRLYIADGHHRAASASRARAELRAAGRATAEADYLFAVAFPSSQLRILPYNRLVRDLGGLDAVSFLERLSKLFALSPLSPASPPRGHFSLYLDGIWHGLRPLTAPPMDQGPIAALDVSRLQDLVLGPILGITDPRTDKRLEFVGGIRGTGELEAAVKSGRAAAAFSLHATSLEDLMSVADVREVMPPKSTWFEPKLRDGLLSYRVS